MDCGSSESGRPSQISRTDSLRDKGDDDNKLFNISGDKLVTKAVFDYEDEDSYSVRVRISDAENRYYERSFQIEITNANDPFTGIELDENSVEENLPPGSLVGELAAQDPDGVPTKGLNKGLVAYYPFDGNSEDQTRNKNHGALQGGAKLTEDRFGRDNSALYLDGNGDWVDINGVADDVKRSVTMATWIQADPANSGTRRSILAVNSALGEQGGSLGGSNILLLLIGRRSSDETLTRKFVIFDAITGGYEAMSQTDVADGRWHHVAYTTDGEVGNFFVDGVREGSHATDYEFQENFRWSLGQEFDDARPSDYLKGLLDDVRIYNRILSDNEIKALYETYTYRLVSGEGDDGNANFKVVSNMLQTNQKLDFEAQKTHSVRVEVSDTDGQTFEQVFQIQVLNTNDAPNGITLGPDSVSENSKKGTSVGNLTAIDPDSSDTHTYKLVKDAGDEYSNAQFAISGKSLRTNTEFDYEAASEHRLLIEVRDRAGATLQQEVLVKIEDSNDAPTGLTLDNSEITESAASGTSIGTLTAIDPDEDDAHTFKISGGSDKAFFAIDASTGQLFEKATKLRIPRPPQCNHPSHR